MFDPTVIQMNGGADLKTEAFHIIVWRRVDIVVVKPRTVAEIEKGRPDDWRVISGS
jgi:hypothetical protein